jgi:transposase
LLRADLLPEAWIAPPPIRQLRALLRHRVALVRLRTRLRNRIHAIVAGHGHDRPAGGYWTGPGRAWLAALNLPAVSRELAGDDWGLIGAIQGRIDRLDWEIHQRARPRPAGEGLDPAARRRPVHRAGDPRRGRRGQPVRLGAQASILGRADPHRPRQRPGPPATGTSGKEGSVWLRWVLCEAAQTAKRSPQFTATFQRIAKRRGKKIAATALARKLLTRAWHLLTDAEHATAPQPAAPPQAAR